MKNAFLAFGILAFLGTTPAMAADMVAPAPYDWTGAFVGLEAGADLLNSQWSSPTNTFVTFNTNGTGVALGGVAGYRKQTSNNLVLGTELSGDWLSTLGSANCALITPTCNTRQDFLGLAQINVGIASGVTHFYFGGGAALGDFQYNETVSLAQSWTGGMRLGWTVGAGADFALTNQWQAGLRYNYYDFGTQSIGGGISPALVNFQENGHLVTIRFEHKF